MLISIFLPFNNNCYKHYYRFFEFLSIHFLNPKELSRRVDRRRLKRQPSRRHKRGFNYKWLGE